MNDLANDPELTPACDPPAGVPIGPPVGHDWWIEPSHPQVAPRQVVLGSGGEGTGPEARERDRTVGSDAPTRK